MGIKIKSVLLVDDNAVIRKVLREMFETAGYTCNESESGAQAVEHAEELSPDIIVLDFSMPDMNGLQAASLIKKKLPLTPIIMFTMFVTEAFAESAFAAGVTEVISKERSFDLLPRVDSLLGT